MAAARRFLCRFIARHGFESPLSISQSCFSSSNFTQSPPFRPSLDRFFRTGTPVNAIKSTIFIAAPWRNSASKTDNVGVHPWNAKSQGFHNLLLQGIRKQRPSAKARKKRAVLRPSGPHRWVIYKEGEPIPPSRPNEGSVRRRKHRKRMEQRAAFRSGEAQKRKDQMAAVRRRKAIKKIERKMAAVARERAWAERLAQLKQAEGDAAKTTA